MIVNTKADFDALSKEQQESFKYLLGSTINSWDWNGSDWVLTQNTETIEKFGFDLSDFPDPITPPEPKSNPNKQQENQKKLERIGELKLLLRDTDYVTLSDYDQDKPEVISQRALWRSEIRYLESEINQDLS